VYPRSRQGPEMTRELLIRSQDGHTRNLSLDRQTLSLGRSAANDLCYPDDPILSRQHLTLEREGDDWVLNDLGSKNGTQVNGDRVIEKVRLRPGDRIVAGRLTMIYDDPFRGSQRTLEFFEDDEATGPTTTSVVTNLNDVISPKDGSLESALGAAPADGVSRMRALLEAGRELAGHRPLAELFGVILDLAVHAVGARRGVLLTLEKDNLMVRAARGEGFRISAAVRDRVLVQKTSLLVGDASQDAALKGSMTIVEQRVRSLMAAPLQTDQQVIGLIYVDSPDVVRPFTAEDLNLLTVLANVAATRIEHARLVEHEQAERVLLKELEQAAEIQRSLLPREQPFVKGVDVAGHSVPCRAVGGDYFDFFPYEDGRMAVVIGDVAGKGLPAALMMASLQARVQVLAEEARELAPMVHRLNRTLSTRCPSNRFISFFIMLIDPANGQLRYVNAGHNAPLLMRTGGEIERLEEGGPVLGIGDAMTYAEAAAPFRPGDIVALYSDGVTEARDASGAEFGEERLIAELRLRRNEPSRAILDSIDKALAGFLGGVPVADDMTLVVARML
ncbi:MAG: SpoIIE family protein phosphatase, partial [Bryobacteraceae bacterium]